MYEKSLHTMSLNYRWSIALENVQRIADALGIEAYTLFIESEGQK